MKIKNLIRISSYALLTFTIAACGSSKSPTSGFIARMEVKEPIEGVCDNNNVLVMLPFAGNNQVKAVAPKTDEALEKELNSSVAFLQGKTDYKDEGMVGLVINCKGQMVQCRTSNKTQSPELDEQIVAVFAQMKNWEAGTYNGKRVDTSVLYSFTIENGKISL
jgi:hypothetical protein